MNSIHCFQDFAAKLPNQVPMKFIEHFGIIILWNEQCCRQQVNTFGQNGLANGSQLREKDTHKPNRVACGNTKMPSIPLSEIIHETNEQMTTILCCLLNVQCHYNRWLFSLSVGRRTEWRVQYAALWLKKQCIKFFF